MKPWSPLLPLSLCSLACLGSPGCGRTPPSPEDEVGAAPVVKQAPKEIPPSPPAAPVWIPESRYDQPIAVKVDCFYAYSTDGRCGGGYAAADQSGPNTANLLIQRQDGETVFQIAKLSVSSGAHSPSIEPAAPKFDGKGKAEARLWSNDARRIMTQGHVVTLQSGRLNVWMQRMEETRECNTNRGQTTCYGSIEWDGHAPPP